MYRGVVATCVFFVLACAKGTGTEGQQGVPLTEPIEELTAAEQQALDIENYEETTRLLEVHRELWSTVGPTQLMAYGPNLFWLEYRDQWNPVLYVQHDGVENALFTLNGDAVNYRVSEDIAVTAVQDGLNVIYTAVDLDGASLGETVLPSPGGGLRWWSFAADGDDIFLVDESHDALQMFAPGGAPQTVTTFTELGVEMGLFMDFDIEGDEMVFIESGRIWSADLVNGTASWLGNETQATSVDTTATHIVYQEASGLQIIERATGFKTPLDEAVEGYQLNGTYTLSHMPRSGTYSLVGDVLVYLAHSGVFAYNLVTHQVEPILLEPRDAEVRITYINPVATSDGVVYVKGLESESGSVGSDGPVYRVEHPFLTR